MSERTTIRLPADLFERAKCKAAAEGRTLASLIEEGLRLALARKRVMPRISKATGGLMPGIDTADGSALQEMDDLEYVERMKHFK